MKSDCVREMFVRFVQENNFSQSRLGQTGRTELKSTKHNIPNDATVESPILNKTITTSSIRGQIPQIIRESESSQLVFQPLQ